MSNCEIGYMCKIDFDHEAGYARGGVIIYPSVEDLKDHHDCWESCGIVEVKVTINKVIKETNFGL